MKAYAIEWNVSDEEYDEEEEKEILKTLPKEVEIPKELTNIDDISDWLSNEFGFCHCGFCLLDDNGNNVKDDIEGSL